MAAIPKENIDPTLEAADKALEVRDMEKPQRASRLGMSQIGEECNRMIWYRFRIAVRQKFPAKTLKAFEDGHKSEALQAERLRLVPGLTLDTIDPKTGNQFEYTDLNNHFVGKCDGKVMGLLQAPKKLHIWEHKSNERKFTEFKKLKTDLGEKAVLRKWNFTYWCQAILYMFYEGTDRHYTTVSTPGVRDVDSCRTEADTAYALQLRSKAERIILASEPPERISNNPDFFKCKFCENNGVCHKGDMPDRNCRTCLHSSPIEFGAWHCARFGKNLTQEEQVAGCPAHLFLPKLVPGEVMSATNSSVTYKLKSGATWTDSEKS